jgi:hypothetical protein
METSNSIKPTEVQNDNIKLAGDWYNSAFSTMSDVYKKQLNRTFDFYNTILKPCQVTEEIIGTQI